MAKTGYIGVDGTARKIKGLYVGVNGVARKIKAAYVGVNGIARQWYAVEPPREACLTFSSSSAFSISVATPGWNGTMEYSRDKSTWAIWNGEEIAAVNNGGTYVLYLSGTGNTKVAGAGANKWTLTGSDIACNGNIEVLLDYATVAAGNHPTMATSCYSYMFVNGTGLTTAPALPATTLTNNCYISMFAGCAGLTTAPALPATTLADNCYYSMFFRCIGLTTAPALPATTLADSCYNSMFGLCTGLTTAPALPATTLADNCYANMFYGCTKLKLSATQTGSYSKAYRIPTFGTGVVATGALANMFDATGGTFTGTPEINTTYYLDASNTIV